MRSQRYANLPSLPPGALLQTPPCCKRTGTWGSPRQQGPAPQPPQRPRGPPSGAARAWPAQLPACAAPRTAAGRPGAGPGGLRRAGQGLLGAGTGNMLGRAAVVKTGRPPASAASPACAALPPMRAFREACRRSTAQPGRPTWMQGRCMTAWQPSWQDQTGSCGRIFSRQIMQAAASPAADSRCSLTRSTPSCSASGGTQRAKVERRGTWMGQRSTWQELEVLIC